RISIKVSSLLRVAHPELDVVNGSEFQRVVAHAGLLLLSVSRTSDSLNLFGSLNRLLTRFQLPSNPQPLTLTLAAIPSADNKIIRAIDAFMRRIIDYAGLFPPANLPLDEALAEFRMYQRHMRSRFLGRFVMPLDGLDKLSAPPGELLR